MRRLGREVEAPWLSIYDLSRNSGVFNGWDPLLTHAFPDLVERTAHGDLRGQRRKADVAWTRAGTAYRPGRADICALYFPFQTFSNAGVVFAT